MVGAAGRITIVVDAETPVRLLINEVGNRKPWLGLRLDSPGARVEVLRQGAPSLWRRAATDGSYASANDPRVLVGLGEAAAVTGVRVVWPDGSAETFPAPPLRTYTSLTRGKGKPLEKKTP